VDVAIVGAGSVGLALGARLARAGARILYIVRRPEAAGALEERRVAVIDPESGGSWTAAVDAIVGFDGATGRLASGPVIFCTRTPDLESAARSLAAVAPDALAVSAQNGVENEAMLAPLFGQVAGMVVRHTCTRVDDRSVRALGSGRLVLGLHPSPGGSPEGASRVSRLAELLRGAGFDVGVSTEIARDKWLKLCVNLMSTPNALVRRDEHRSVEFVECKARLLEEARAVLEAVGIEATSCDGRDRNLDAEIAAQRASIANGTSARPLPLYNAVWSALRRGAPLEADLHHRRILELARPPGIPAPTNARALQLLLRCAKQQRGPESVAASEFLGG
jgi:2-dehydropantoate 2-reductase